MVVFWSVGTSSVLVFALKLSCGSPGGGRSGGGRSRGGRSGRAVPRTVLLRAEGGPVGQNLTGPAKIGEGCGRSWLGPGPGQRRPGRGQSGPGQSGPGQSRLKPTSAHWSWYSQHATMSTRQRNTTNNTPLNLPTQISFPSLPFPSTFFHCLFILFLSFFFHSFLPLLRVLSWNCGGVFETPGPSNVHVRSSRTVMSLMYFEFFSAFFALVHLVLPAVLVTRRPSPLVHLRLRARSSLFLPVPKSHGHGAQCNGGGSDPNSPLLNNQLWTGLALEASF